MSETDIPSISTRIQNWLTGENLQNNIIPDPSADTNIAFWPNPDIKMHAIVVKDRITIVVGALFGSKALSILLSSKNAEEAFFKKSKSRIISATL